MKNTLLSEKKKLYKTLRLFVFFLFLFFVFVGIKNFHVIPFLFRILKALFPFLFGLLLAFFLEPFMRFFEKKLPKLCAVIFPFLILCSFLFLLGIFIVPSFLKEGSELIQNFPSIINDIKDFLGSLWIFQNNKALKGKLFSLMDHIPKEFHKFLETVFPHICSNLLTIVTTSFFSILIGIYLLYDFSSIKEWFLKKIPRTYRKDTKNVFKTVRSAMNRYFLSVFLIMFLVFLTQLIGFLFSGMKSPVFFASLCALTDFIPYVGPYIGGIPCILIAFSMNTTVGILTLFSIFIVQFLENSFYQPYILGKTLYLPPWLILTGIVFASSFFGLVGMLLVTPVLMILKILVPFLFQILKKYRNESIK